MSPESKKSFIELINCKESKEGNKRMLKCEISKEATIDESGIILIQNKDVEKLDGKEK